jgi:hypothetical protein
MPPLMPLSGTTNDGNAVGLAKSSARMGRASASWRESRERRFDGLAPLEVNGSFRHPGGISQTRLLAISITPVVDFGSCFVHVLRWDTRVFASVHREPAVSTRLPNKKRIGIIPMRDQRSDTVDRRPWQVSGAQSGCAVRSGGDLTEAAVTRLVECHLLESASV